MPAPAPPPCASSPSWPPPRSLRRLRPIRARPSDRARPDHRHRHAHRPARLRCAGERSPSSVSTISSTPSPSLADLARAEPGVSAAAFGATGNAPRNFPTTRSFNIRGLDGNRVLIQVDGVRQPEQFTFGNAQLIGRDYFEPSLYRTAEILKGSASALYGSDAVGGVLSFISPAPSTLLAAAKRDVLAGASCHLRLGHRGMDRHRQRRWPHRQVCRRRYSDPPRGPRSRAQRLHTPPIPPSFTVDAGLFRVDYTPAAGRTLFLTGETFTKTTHASFPSLITTTFAGQTGRQRITRDRATLGFDFTSESGYFRNVQARLSWQDAKVRESYVTNQSIPVGPPPAPQVFVPRRRVRDSDFRNRGLSGSVQVESAAPNRPTAPTASSRASTVPRPSRPASKISPSLTAPPAPSSTRSSSAKTSL